MKKYTRIRRLRHLRSRGIAFALAFLLYGISHVVTGEMCKHQKLELKPGY
jgi:hypothetical protein